MNGSDLIRRLHQHRMWANQQLLAATRRLPPDQLHQPFEIGQGSVWQTLTHLLAAEYVWLEALLGNENPLLPGDLPGKLPGNQGADGAITSHDELVRKWETLDERWDEYLNSMTDQSLDDVVHKVSTSSGIGRSHGTRRDDVLLHVCTHSQYTTAQLVNMLRKLDQTPLPDVMLITMARQEVSGGMTSD